MNIENPDEYWIPVGSEGTTLRVGAETAREILESRLAQPTQDLVPIPINGREGTTLLVESSRVASVQAQIKKTP